MSEHLESKATSGIDSDCASTRFESLSISNSSGADDVVVWSPVTFVTRSPGSRVFPSAVVHRSSLYIFGGHDGTIYRNDLLIFNLETHGWQLDIELGGGLGPSPRDAHAAVVHADCMYVFGGYDSKRYLNDFHRFHFDSAVWSTVAYGGGNATQRLPAAALGAWLCGRAAEVGLNQEYLSEESLAPSDVLHFLGAAFRDWKSSRR